jgi:hypothetical protein
MGPVHWQRSSLALLGVAAGLLALASPARAAEEVRVTVVAILATDRNQVVDDRLKDIAEEVRKKHPWLTGFRLAIMTCKPMVVGAKDTFELVEGQEATVQVKHGADKNDMVCLKLKVPRLGEITYGTVCGKFFPVMTRYQTKDKEHLFIAVAVQPCKGKKP